VMDTLTSHRRLPSSIFPSQVPTYLNSLCSVDTTDAASCAACISGKKTISMRALPARLKSMRERVVSSSLGGRTVVFPVSCSSCIRSIPTEKNLEGGGGGDAVFIGVVVEVGRSPSLFSSLSGPLPLPFLLPFSLPLLVLLLVPPPFSKNLRQVNLPPFANGHRCCVT